MLAESKIIYEDNNKNPVKFVLLTITKTIINKYKGKKTIIIFSALEDSGSYCDKIIKIKSGKIVNE